MRKLICLSEYCYIVVRCNVTSVEVTFAALVICFPLSCFLSLFYLHSASDNVHPLYILYV